MSYSSDQVRELLREVKDPEIPSVDIVGLGIVRDISVDGTSVEVKITPTYSGCPAMHQIENEVAQCLRERGFSEVAVTRVHHPAWTTEWMSEEAKQQMKAAGIAPPGAVKVDSLVTINALAGGERGEVLCPFCESKSTELRSEFGSTACKALYFCNACCQPFDHFKAF